VSKSEAPVSLIASQRLMASVALFRIGTGFVLIDQ
jgi:hypothetical protein